MVATTRLCDPLWAFVLGDYDDYYDDEATVKLKDESREPEQQSKEEQEEAPITSLATKSKAAKNKLKQKSDPSSEDDEEVMQYFLGPGDHAGKQTKRSKKIFQKRQKKLASTQVRLKEVDGKETLQADGGEWRLFGDMPIPLKEDVETFKARRKASLLEERTQEPPLETIATKKEEPRESLAFIDWWKLKSRENSLTNNGSNARNGKSGAHSSGSTIEDGILGDAGMVSLVEGTKDFEREALVIDLTEVPVKRGRGIMDDDDIQSVEKQELQTKSSKDISEKVGPVKQEKRGDLQGKGTEESTDANEATLDGSDQRMDQSDDECRLVSLSLPQKTSSTLGSGQGSDQSDDEHRILSLSLPKTPPSDLNQAEDEGIANKSIKDDAVVRARLSKPPQSKSRQGFLGGLAARRNTHKFNRHLLIRSEVETASGHDRASDAEGASKSADEPSDARNGNGQLRHSTTSCGSKKRPESSAKTRPANSFNVRADRSERTTVQSESDGRIRSNRAKYLRKVEDPRYRNARPDSYTRDTRSDPYAKNRESKDYRNSQPAEFEYYDVTMMDDEYSYEDALENRRALPASVQREIDANLSKRSSASKLDQLRTDGQGNLRNLTTVDSKQRDRLSYAERLQYLRTSSRKSSEKETPQCPSYPDLLEAGPSFGMIPAGSLRLR